ncbi:PREDICTED: trans-Golgi network integral membrane protein 1-like [Dufourea novaeangliae]|uniref:Trans-Golgi network integral membrane protein 2 n=1 Tax=Dufourea novaeangliae TaxID=178035 RepID=A0A154PC02_DUFNO|nr:PREDICTED: trans-Golgi network integral membrane protein 1-like [Dufourea novaeangliae]KZC09426.1 Trans-Golgi network integral membrane protein 2 [Dufourea novaeangliae]
MGKCTARSFYGLATFAFLLYFAKVSSTSPPQQTIIDVMKSDPKLHNVPISLYNNNITSVCANQTYPKGNDIMDYEDKNIYLCLAFYDTLYKVFATSQVNKSLQDKFSDKEAFYSYIEEFFPTKEDVNGTVFCDKIKGLTFSSEKLKPILSTIDHLNNLITCYRLCFNMRKKFNPFCGILAWSKSIDDDNAKKIDIVHKTKDAVEKEKTLNKSNLVTSSTELKSSSKAKLVPTTKSNNVHKIGTTENNNRENENVLEPKVPDIQKLKPENTHIAAVPNTLDKPLGSSSVKIKSSTINNLNAVSGNEKNNVNDATDPKLDQQNTGIKPDHPKKSQEELKKLDENIADNDVLENGKAINGEVKTDTISKNTQSHDNSANQEDWSHLEDDPNDGPEPPTDTDDQNQNMPEPSEQRDIIPPYHSLRSDEESHFFTYFTIVSLISIAAYIGYYNKQKILAIVLEGRRSRNSRSRRRPSTANYRKLDCTLEEAVTSQCNANVTHVIY